MKIKFNRLINKYLDKKNKLINEQIKNQKIK